MIPALGLLQAADPSSAIAQFAPIVLMLVVGYFLLFRPMQKQRREQDEMRSALKPGDEVLTTGGLYGTVTKLRDERVHLRIADSVQVEIARAAISSVISPKE